MAEYTFTKLEGLLAHYSVASSVFEPILCSGKLRLSAFRLMRDPAENKDIRPNICSMRSSPADHEAINQVYALIKAERDRMHLLSLSEDAKARGEFPDFDCCWSRPRMWEQYGDVHRGACLLFDRCRLKRAIRKQSSAEGVYSGKVKYARDGPLEVFRRMVNADEILAHEQPVRAVRNYIEENLDAYFFLKSDDFTTEYEYRFVVTGGEEVDCIFVEYLDALVAVVLGERFPEWQKARSDRGLLESPREARPNQLEIRAPASRTGRRARDARQERGGRLAITRPRSSGTSTVRSGRTADSIGKLRPARHNRADETPTQPTRRSPPDRPRARPPRPLSRHPARHHHRAPHPLRTPQLRLPPRSPTTARPLLALDPQDQKQDRRPLPHPTPSRRVPTLDDNDRRIRELLARLEQIGIQRLDTDQHRT